MPKKQLATITILIKNRIDSSAQVNQILSQYGDLIIARLGINVGRTHLKNYRALITIVVEGSTKQIHSLNRILDELYGVVAQASIVTEQ